MEAAREVPVATLRSRDVEVPGGYMAQIEKSTSKERGGKTGTKVVPSGAE